MPKPKLHITIVSQEKQLESTEADSLTLPTVEGEITVLPGHIPLLSRLQTGELHYTNENQSHSFVISTGFVDVGPDSIITVLVDTAVAAREISLEKAQAAVRAAHEAMAQTVNQEELVMIEASLKRALLEVKVAEKTKHAQI